MKLKALAQSVSFWAIIFSLVYNVILLAMCLFFMRILPDKVTYVSLFFILIYIFIAQPIKDWLLSFLVFRYINASRASFTKIEKRATRIISLSDLLNFSGWLVRHWQMRGLRLVIYHPDATVYFFNSKGKYRRIRFNSAENLHINHYVSEITSGKNLSEMPPSIRTFFFNRHIRAMLPLNFRDRAMGFIGFHNTLARTQFEVLEIISQRFALALENEMLLRTMPRSEILKKEFKLAERIEGYLTAWHTEKIGTYSVKRLESAWEKKYFAAIFTAGLIERNVQTSGKAPFFALLCRLAQASHRNSALQLFAVQGYFTALTQSAQNITQMVTSLQRALLEHENGRVMLEGYIISFQNNITGNRCWQLQPFGNHLAYKNDVGWVLLPELQSLGSKDWVLPDTIVFEKVRDLILSIREYPLVLIGQSKVV